MQFTLSFGDLDGKEARNVNSCRLTRNITLKQHLSNFKDTQLKLFDKYYCTYRLQQDLHQVCTKNISEQEWKSKVQTSLVRNPKMVGSKFHLVSTWRLELHVKNAAFGRTRLPGLVSDNNSSLFLGLGASGYLIKTKQNKTTQQSFT